MVAPVFSEAGDVQFYLPEGRWTHLWHNDEIQGAAGISSSTIS